MPVAIHFNKRTHRNDELRAQHAGQSAILVGWVNSYRDHGGMVFIDLRDRGGITQVKFNPETDPKAHALARSLRNEDCVAVEGRVGLRGENVNPKLPTGEIEVEARALDVLSKSDATPFEIDDFTKANEDLRLQYRFLDLRRPSMQRVLRLRHDISKAVRDYFDQEGFLEIETPFLTKSTPEGARDYLVPSRLQPGHFYALPQSPQLFKQLFMVAGCDRYAQIVRCFRDEDLRADRQPEFTQIDLEMSFVDMDDVMTAVEGCVAAMFRAGRNIEVERPFPRVRFAEAVDRFGIDRPDTRFGLELTDVTEIVRGTEFKVFSGAIEAGGVAKCLCVKAAEGADKLTRKITDGLSEELKGIGAGGLPVTKVVEGQDGTELATGVAKFVQPVRDALCERVGAEPGDVMFFAAGPYNDVCKFLHHARTRLIEILQLKPSKPWELLWVVDFPMFEWDEQEQRYYSTHHPFTSPRDEDVALLDTDPAKVRAKAYDLVLNGTEMAGGSIRIHRRDIQQKVFKLLGISDEEAKEKFEFLMEALRFGPPPHGGIAFGLDRWVMLLADKESLRDVIAYPKTQRAVCPLTGAPGPVATGQLEELGIDLRPEVWAKLEQRPSGPDQHVHRKHDE
ncbi:MAG: aspartate--tRNA ligase [Phycisphaerales bacterium]|nr:MAG: aspartate--tRNA ligase [Phycisphaerales bacterium]